MNKKIYYKIDMTLLSPLSIGSGENAQTDKDVIVDSLGNPFIPATAIAGVFRSYVAKKGITNEDGISLEQALFGAIESLEKNKIPCKIRIYDARFEDGSNKFHIATRDCVKLENKVAVDGAKFDMEAVETGAHFTSYVELLSDNSLFVELVEELLSALNSGRILLGSKTSRGYGRVCLKVKKREFLDVDEWLEFDMFNDLDWTDDVASDLELINNIDAFELCIQLNCVGGLSIREYTTDVDLDGGTMPDYKSMSLCSVMENNEQTPVIPGTSWAGAFRNRFTELTDEETAKSVFGDVDTKSKTTKKSRIVFSESILSDGTYKLSTRNAIDRFSGATKDGALYTEKTYYYGKTELVISFSEKPEKKALWALGVCLSDLHNGFLAIGGLTSIGRGLFEIVSLKFNSKDLSVESIIEGKIDDFVEEVSKR